MNDIIVKLSKQAVDYAAEQYGPQRQGEKVWDPYTYDKKFAELIVKECMEQVWYTREDGINGNVSEVIKDRIKQHFGVEEW